MAAVRAIDDLVVNTAAAVLALEILEEVQPHNHDHESDEDSPRAKQTLCSRKGAPETCMRACEHSSWRGADVQTS